MKKYILILMCFFLWNCKEDELPLYNGKTCIYFAVKDANTYLNEMNFSFGLLNVMDSVIRIPVAGMGDTVGYDRYFNFVVDSMSGVKGVHLDLPERGILPAGSAIGYIPVSLHRILDDDQIYSLYLRLIPNETFELNLLEVNSVDLTRMTLNFSSSITKPKMWTDSWFGYFSVTKYNTFCEICGKDASYWSGNPSAGAHLALANIFKAYVESKILEGQTAALRDPQNKQEKGYMTMRGVNKYMTVPNEWPNAY